MMKNQWADVLFADSFVDSYSHYYAITINMHRASKRSFHRCDDFDPVQVRLQWLAQNILQSRYRDIEREREREREK